MPPIDLSFSQVVEYTQVLSGGGQEWSTEHLNRDVV